MLEQYTYEPYGALVAAELFHPHAMNRAGHQGLFFERFDGSYDDYTLFRVLQGTAFITGAKGLYYNRNRFYSPTLCRFTTRDPNQSGLTNLDALSKHGDALYMVGARFDTQGHYQDGMNCYNFVNSNPLNGTDPSGLSEAFDYFVDTSEEWGGYAGGIIAIARPFLQIIEDYYYDAARVADGFYDDFDGALSEFQANQEYRWDLSIGIWQKLAASSKKSPHDEGLPPDFFLAAVPVVVYVAKDAKTGKHCYTGHTSQNLASRQTQHHGDPDRTNWKLEKVADLKNEKQARAIEQLIIEENPQFENKINAVDTRHKWYHKAKAWARKYMKGKRIRFRR